MKTLAIVLAVLSFLASACTTVQPNHQNNIEFGLRDHGGGRTLR